MRGKIFLILASIFILSIFVVSAIDTSITLKVNPNSEVNLNILNPETIQPYQSFVINSSDAGVAQATFSGDVGLVAISFVVRKEGKILQYIKAGDYGNFSTSSAIYIDTLKETVAAANTTTPAAVNNTSAAVNDTLNNTKTAIQNDTSNTLADTDAGVTGKAIADTDSTNKSSFFSGVFVKIKGFNYWGVLKIAGYIIMAAVILAVVFFMVVKLKSKVPILAKQLKSPQSATTVKYSGRDVSDAERRINQAQEELRKAQEEINLIKNRKSLVQDAEKKFQEAKKNLDRARGNYF